MFPPGVRVDTGISLPLTSDENRLHSGMRIQARNADLHSRGMPGGSAQSCTDQHRLELKTSPGPWSTQREFVVGDSPGRFGYRDRLEMRG